MKCSCSAGTVIVILQFLSSLVQSKEERRSQERSFHVHDKDLLLDGLKSSTASQDKDTIGKKHFSSRAEKRQYNSVNIPVPYNRVHYTPIHVAKPVAYSNKPDVFINHVHVNNGGICIS